MKSYGHIEISEIENGFLIMWHGTRGSGAGIMGRIYAQDLSSLMDVVSYVFYDMYLPLTPDEDRVHLEVAGTVSSKDYSTSPTVRIDSLENAWMCTLIDKTAAGQEIARVAAFDHVAFLKWVWLYIHRAFS